MTGHYTTEDYAFAQAEFHTHRRTLAGYVALLSEAARLLRDHTDRVTVSGVGIAAPRAGSAVIDGQALPAPAEIQRLLVLYRGAYDRLRTTWDGLPPPERAHLRPPPSDLPTLQPAVG
ncbi:hypothetical protein MKK75_09230 [Methylobacterium sp. J-030]|uniref:hypothetical protein n=1 Tax=Methylobacterium sp. J-030 TaxID=2836627 RepID=UPI001FB8FD8A|nr:hypothetical protein [Methylobacterium sp. J-030]MCJ2068981.1 hypothetical protein [Methylobacterium sp. J-030]